jgi:mRNA interferase RelE/StbE
VEIKYSKAAVKFLRKQNKSSQNRIMDAIEKIPEGDIVKLQGISGYRLRVGNYRILFDFFGNIIDIIDIDNRGQVYK